jgi:hypothetical protein
VKIVKTNIEARLVDFANSVRNARESYYVLHFRFSRLSDVYKNEFQLKIAVNIINDLYREESGEIMKLPNHDVFVLYEGDDKDLVNKSIFQLRYLFFDDSLANHSDGSENKDFCHVYDLNFQWGDFFRCVSEIYAESNKKVFVFDDTPNEVKPLTAKQLFEVEKEIDENRLDSSIRKQPICSIKNIGAPKPIFHEVYINIQSLQNSLKTNSKITSNKWLFMYLTQKLDEKVIETISINPEKYLYLPLSLNLNMETVLSKNFTEFCEIAKDFKCQIVIELSVSDVFSDINKFHEVNEVSKLRNHKICIDGLNNESFIQVDRKNLGFDLAKLQWNADMRSDLEFKEANQKLKDSVERCGGNRLILCRCDDIHAVEYGHALGINLFQGRFADRVLNPNSKIIN